MVVMKCVVFLVKT